MRLRGYTDSTDWHPLTLLAMMKDRNAWQFGVTWREWRIGLDYTWYDGPIFQLCVGPFWVALS